MISAGSTAAAFAKLGEVLVDSAKANGHKHVTGGSPLCGMQLTSHNLIMSKGACELSSGMH